MNYRISINLMAMQGAQLRSVVIDGKNVNCMIIPTQQNHISVTVDPATRKPKAAYLNMMADAPSDAYYEKTLRDNPQAKLPSHMVYNNPSREARAQMESVAGNLLRADQAYMSGNPTEDEIRRKAHYDTQRALYLGRAYELGNTGEYHSTAPQATVSDYVPEPSASASAPEQSPVPPSRDYNDLPF